MNSLINSVTSKDFFKEISIFIDMHENAYVSKFDDDSGIISPNKYEIGIQLNEDGKDLEFFEILNKYDYSIFKMDNSRVNQYSFSIYYINIKEDPLSARSISYIKETFGCKSIQIYLAWASGLIPENKIVFKNKKYGSCILDAYNEVESPFQYWIEIMEDLDHISIKDDSISADMLYGNL